MRRILIDHAKQRGRAKRGGGGERVALDEAAIVGSAAPDDLLELDTALSQLPIATAEKARLSNCCFLAA